MKLSIPDEQLKEYKRTARVRWQAEKAHTVARRARAWELAKQAAELLKRDYQVQRVVVFGSLVQPDRFTAYSDVDLAAWGLTSANWLKAIGAVRHLDRTGDIEINLVDTACCSDELLAAIERDGVSL
jgi:predicted nucleotidyltransferase